MGAQDSYLSLAQAIDWVRTRSPEAVKGLADPYSVETLKVELFKERFGQRSGVPRERPDGTLGPRRWHNIELRKGDMCSGTDANALLILAALTGRILTLARDVRTGTCGPINESERVDLEFMIHSDNPICPYGLWSRTTGACRYIELRFSFLDLMRAFPAPTTKPTTAARGRMLNRLLQLTADRKFIKELAITAIKESGDYSRRAFDEAWRELPPDRKVGRGKHGPRRK